MKKSLLYGLLGLIPALVSCSSDGVEYIPFKSSENGGWGLINSKGDVKFDGEFKNDITLANHGAFFAKNNEGEWELYSLDEKTPKSISSGYVQAGAFLSEVAPVVKEGEKITLINNKGEVMVTLDKAEGKPIKACGNFNEGLAYIVTSEGYGMINTSGEVVVKPVYKSISACQGGVIIGVNEKDNIDFIDKTGKVTATISPEDLDLQTSYLTDGFFAAKEKKTDRWGILDSNGKWKMDPTGKIKNIGEISGKQFIYSDNDDKAGVMNFDRKELIKASYNYLRFVCGGDLIYAGEYLDGDKVASLINLKGKILIENIKNGWANDLFPNAIFLSFSHDGDFLMYNNKGKEIKTEAGIASIKDNIVGDDVIESQYIDVEALSKIFDIKVNGLAGLSLNMTPQTAIKELNEQLDNLDSTWNTSGIDTLSQNPRYYSGSYIDKYFFLNDFFSRVSIGVEYRDSIVDYNVTYEEKYDEYYDYYSYEPVETYNFRDIKPTSIKVSLSSSREYVTEKLSKILTDQLKTLGTTQESEKNYIVIKTKDGYFKLSLISSEEISVEFCKDLSSLSYLE